MHRKCKSISINLWPLVLHSCQSKSPDGNLRARYNIPFQFLKVKLKFTTFVAGTASPLTVTRVFTVQSLGLAAPSEQSSVHDIRAQSKSVPAVQFSL